MAKNDEFLASPSVSSRPISSARRRFFTHHSHEGDSRVTATLAWPSRDGRTAPAGGANCARRFGKMNDREEFAPVFSLLRQIHNIYPGKPMDKRLRITFLVVSLFLSTIASRPLLAKTWYVPGVANTPGSNGTFFVSDLALANSSEISANVTIGFIPMS